MTLPRLLEDWYDTRQAWSVASLALSELGRRLAIDAGVPWDSATRSQKLFFVAEASRLSNIGDMLYVLRMCEDLDLMEQLLPRDRTDEVDLYRDFVRRKIEAYREKAGSPSKEV